MFVGRCQRSPVRANRASRTSGHPPSGHRGTIVFRRSNAPAGGNSRGRACRCPSGGRPPGGRSPSSRPPGGTCPHCRALLIFSFEYYNVIDRLPFRFILYYALYVYSFIYYRSK